MALKIAESSKILNKIFDFHCHLGPDFHTYSKNYPIHGVNLMPSWKTLDMIDFSVAPHNDFTDPTFYLNSIQQNSEILNNSKVPIYLFLPSLFRPQALEIFTHLLDQLHPAGVKIHPLQNFPLTHAVLDPVMECIGKRKILVYIHTDWVPSAEFGKYKITLKQTFGWFAQEYPDITFIMGHAGNNDSWVGIWKLMQKYPNTICETSMAPSTGELEKVIHRLGVERVLFGSNFPYCSPDVEIKKIRCLFEVSDEEKSRIFYDNAQKRLATYSPINWVTFHSKIEPFLTPPSHQIETKGMVL